MGAPVPNPDVDTKPEIWIGHLAIPADDMRVSYDFYLALGLRSVHFDADRIGVLELAGGTHLTVVPRGQDVGFLLTDAFDLMVDDLDGTRDAWTHLDPTEIEAGGVHRWFRFDDPSGNRVTVFDTHVTGVV